MAKSRNKGPDAPSFSTQRELIVMMKPDSNFTVATLGLESTTSEISDINKLLGDAGAQLTPLFGANEQAVARSVEAATAGKEDPILLNMKNFYHVDAPDENLETLAEQLRANALVEGCYIKPAGELPVMLDTSAPRQPEGTDAPPATPAEWRARQGYLNPAPTGVDAYYAWTVPGGRGGGVNIIDLEWAWRFTHMDLGENVGGVLAGTNLLGGDFRAENHGTAVIGEIGGDENAFGVVGICPHARTSAVSFSLPSATAIRTAADRLNTGDIMLLEIHRAGPRFGFMARDDQQGYIAIEWWPDDFLAIRYAVNKGVIVVSAAGNGRQNLDDALYDTPGAGFPAWWRNPFRRNPLDSGSVIVGAGSPPAGTHGRNASGEDVYVDRARLGFSNFGAAVDAQGWGREVTTTGYGGFWADADAPNDRDRWFTDTFSGTSSASPIVVGALGCVQGVLRAHGRIPLTPARARDLLRTTGSPQQAAPGRPLTERIGNRPNLRQMIAAVLPKPEPWTGVQFTGNLAANQTIRWFTYGWPAHWHVLWSAVSTTPRSGAPQIKWAVQVERASDAHITYWISITNLTNQPVQVEGRYAVLGW